MLSACPWTSSSLRGQKQSKLPLESRLFFSKMSETPLGFRLFLSKMSETPPVLSYFFQKQTRRPQFSIVFHKNEWKHPVVSHIFIKNGQEHPVVSSIFSKNRWTRPVVSDVFCPRARAACCGFVTEKKRIHALPRAPSARKKVYPSCRWIDLLKFYCLKFRAVGRQQRVLYQLHWSRTSWSSWWNEQPSPLLSLPILLR